jgi:cytochrome P450
MSTALRLPPGPRRLPIVGSLPAFGRDPLRFLLDLGRNHGDVSYTRFVRTPLYMLNRPELIDEVLIGKHRDCIKDVGTRELIPLVGHGLLTSEGDAWRDQRKLAAPPLQPKRIASYAQTMVACATRELLAFKDGERRDLHEDMMRLTLEIVGKTLLGVDASSEAERIARILEVTMAYMDKQLRSVEGLLPLWVPTPSRYRFGKALAELDAIVYGMIARCKAQGPNAENLLARLVHARDEDGKAMSDVQLRDEAVTMLLAGHETTALTLSFAVYLLSENEPVAVRLRAEIDGQLAERPARMEDLQKLPYLNAVVRETLRLYPPAYAIGREVLRDFELGGYLIPKGSQVMMCPYVVQRDPRLFAEPDRFNPERWLDPASDALPRFAYFPFGGGPRVCIGNHFAMMELALVLSVIVQQVELEVAPGFELEVDPIVTLRPAAGVPVIVHRRKRAQAAA